MEVVHEVAAASPGVHVLPWYNATRRRRDMHKGGFCAYRPPDAMASRRRFIALVESGMPLNASALLANEVLRGDRRCCDCLHYCYSPAHFDTAFVTTLWRTLGRAVSARADGGPAAAVPHTARPSAPRRGE